MERVFLSMSLENWITIGIMAAVLYGGFALASTAIMRLKGGM